MEPRWLILLVLVYASPSQGRYQIDHEILTRLQSLEKQVSVQQYQLELQNSRLDDQASVIAKQQEVIAMHKATIHDLQKTVVEQQADIAKLQTDFTKQQTRIRHLEQSHATGNIPSQDQILSELNVPSAKPAFKDDESVIGNQTNTNTSRRSPVAVHAKRNLKSRLVLEGGSVIAFHAVNTAAQNAHVGVGQKIVFDHALLNIGNGYSTQHNIFTAPKSGIYIFSVSILSWVNNHSEVQTTLRKNGATLARVFAHGDSGRQDQGSVTVVTQLASGDTVWVTLDSPADDSYFGGSFTTFMGCILWPTG